MADKRSIAQEEAVPPPPPDFKAGKNDGAT